jgi:hypothetical protein
MEDQGKHFPKPTESRSPRYIVSYSGTRHVIGEQAAKYHAYRITTCCGFGIHVEREPVEATRDCSFCFAALELAEDIRGLFADGRNMIHLREAADRLGVSQEKVAAAVAGSQDLHWVSAYCHDQITTCRPAVQVAR